LQPGEIEQNQNGFNDEILTKLQEIIFLIEELKKLTPIFKKYIETRALYELSKIKDKLILERENLIKLFEDDRNEQNTKNSSDIDNQ
jgi:hypothetical protein